MADNTSQIAGLFMTPEMYQQQQNQNALASFAKQAEMDPFQRATMSNMYGGYQLGNALAGALGGQDPMLQQLSAVQGVMKGVDPNDPRSLMLAAQKLAPVAPQQAQQLAAQARAAQEQLAKTSSEGLIGGLLKTGKYDSDSIAAYAKSGDIKDLTLVEKTGGSETERLINGLPISEAQKQALRLQRVNSLINNDPNGLKAVSAQIANINLQQQTLKLEQDREKAASEKQAAITKLSNVEGDIDTSLATAAKAIKLAPTSFLSATGQTVGQNIPWSDQKSLKNLVSALNSEKAINTLQDLKAQSKTGATGFGALNQAELQLILDKTRALDPTDKMFKENLTEVMQGWNKIRSASIESRVNLQGKTQQLQELRTLVNTARQQGGFKSQAEKDRANALKAELGVN